MTVNICHGLKLPVYRSLNKLFIGYGTSSLRDWQRVQLRLPGGESKSVAIGLECGPMQFGGVSLSQSGRVIGLVITGAMFLFSAWMYQRTGDWVAAVFALGSLGYGLFFWSRGEDSTS